MRIIPIIEQEKESGELNFRVEIIIINKQNNYGEKWSIDKTIHQCQTIILHFLAKFLCKQDRINELEGNIC